MTTPDRFPGRREEDEGLLLKPASSDPTEVGEIRLVSGVVRIRDDLGIFDPREGSDEKARVSSNDSTSGYLNGKLVAGDGIAFDELDDGANESLRIRATGDSQDEKVKISANDTVAGYLGGKLTAGDYVTLTEQDDGSDETLEFTSEDERVKVSGDDTTEGYLEDKIVAGHGIKLDTLTPAGDEDLKITSGKALAVSFAASVQSFVEATASSWAVLAIIVFPGTTQMQASVSAVKIVAWSSGGAGKPVDFRIYDATNDQVIATLTGVKNAVGALLDMGAISNVPASPAQWELQGMYSGGRSAAKASALTMLFEV